MYVVINGITHVQMYLNCILHILIDMTTTYVYMYVTRFGKRVLFAHSDVKHETKKLAY